MATVTCPTCDREARWDAERARWVCDSCQTAFDAPASATAAAATPPVAAAVEAPRPARGRPPWLPVAGVGALIAVSLIVMLIVMLATGELFGGKLPKGTGHGRLTGGARGDGLTVQPVGLPEPGRGDPDAPLDEAQCRAMFDHVFDLVGGPNATPEMQKTIAEQKDKLLQEMIPKCVQDYKRATYDCAMAARSTDDLGKCDPGKPDRHDDDAKHEARPTEAPPAPPPVEPAPDNEGGE